VQRQRDEVLIARERDGAIVAEAEFGGGLAGRPRAACMAGIGANPYSQTPTGDRSMLVFTEHGDGARALNADPDLLASDREHMNLDLVADHDRLVGPSCQEVYLEIQRERAAADTSARAEVNEALKRLTQR
jgi:hypothetical protein